MSQTVGWTAAPPRLGGDETPTSMPPVASNPGDACSWYCQRAWVDGCQQPGQATGDGSAAVAPPGGPPGGAGGAGAGGRGGGAARPAGGAAHPLQLKAN